MAKHEIPTVTSQPRPKLGTRYAARLRKEGQLPAVVYGHKQDNVPVTLDYRAFTDLLHHNVHLINLEVDSKREPCLIKDVQWDHLGSKIIHVDLARVDLSEEVDVEVEIVITGEPAALQQAGAVLSHPLDALEVRCRADEIPETITVDVGELGVNDAITVADLKLPEGVKAVTDAETVVAQITIVEEVPEEVEAEAAEGAEPEVIGRGGEEEEEGEEA